MWGAAGERLAEASGFALDRPGRAGGLEHFPPRPPEAEMKCPLRVGPPLVRAVAGADYVTLGVEEGSNAPPVCPCGILCTEETPLSPQLRGHLGPGANVACPGGAPGEGGDPGRGRRPPACRGSHDPRLGRISDLPVLDRYLEEGKVW